MKRNIHYLSWSLLGVGWLWAVNTVIWSPELPYLNFNHLNSQMMLIQLSHSLTILGSIVALLIVGNQLGRNTKPLLPTTIKYWLYTVGILLLTLSVVWLRFNHFIYHDFYHAILPLAGNTVPLASAIIIGSLVLPLIKPVILRAPLSWSTAVFVILAIVTFFNHDSFGLLKGESVTYYLLIMSLGIAASEFKLKKATVLKWTLSFLIVNSYLVSIMPDASFFTRGTLETANRFTTPASFTMVATALGFYLLLHHNWQVFFNKLHHRIYFLLTIALLIQNPVSLNIAVRYANHSSLLWKQLLFITGWFIWILLFAFILPPVFNYLQCRYALNKRLTRFWTTDPAMPLDQRTVILAQRVENWLWSKWANILAFGCSYGLALCSIYLMGRPSVFVKQSMLWVNTFLIFCIFKFIQGICNRYWASLFLTVILNFIWIIANMQKMAFRNESILPSETTMINNIPALLKMVSSQLIIVSLLIIIGLVILMIILERKIKGPHLTLRQRLIWLIIPLCVFGSSFFWNQPHSRINTFVRGWGDIPHFIHQSAGALRNGPLVQFLNNIDITIMNKPTDYSASEMKRISKRYTTVANQINRHRTNEFKNQTIIFNLSESFANPNRVPGVKLKNNPIPNIEKLKKNTTSGIMLSSGYGGGTANMEYMALTGFAMCNFAQTLSTPYTQLVPYLRHNPTIIQSFNYAIAIHPYSSKFYDRGIDYPKFGFNKFFYLGNKKAPITQQKKIGANSYLSDETAYDNTLNQLTRHPQGQFINLITMQNHLPYNHLYHHISHYKATVPANGTIAAQVENYAMGIHYTDQAVAKFIKKIDNIDRPITLVFYGDHLPGIYRNSMKKDGLKLHETDYFIYSNPTAQRQGAKNLTTHNHYVGPNDFIAMTAQQTNSKVTPYQALLTQLYQQLPAYTVNTQTNGTNSYNSAPEFINQHGEKVDYASFTAKQKQLWHDYQLVQYDLTAGHQYLLKYKMMR